MIDDSQKSDGTQLYVLIKILFVVFAAQQSIQGTERIDGSATTLYIMQNLCQCNDPKVI